MKHSSNPKAAAAAVAVGFKCFTPPWSTVEESYVHSHIKSCKISTVSIIEKLTFYQHAKVFSLSIGIYSPIKGHMRCGGSWRAKKHSHYCPIIITNEHNASQTCLFCYSKTSHPQKLATKKNKQYLRSVNHWPFDCHSCAAHSFI
ncbi:hypothetical protein PS15p_211126 [Mucor circinelloides]